MSLRDIASVLATAYSQLKAEVYFELGISVTFDPVNRIVTAESRPEGGCRTERVGEGTGNNALRPFDTSPAWGSPHVGATVVGNPVREVGITDLWLPAA